MQLIQTILVTFFAGMGAEPAAFGHHGRFFSVYDFSAGNQIYCAPGYDHP